tara:strand:- start:12147 stop:12362 length:216 start_codon:yes stop_codon:yes gene_type:complete
MGDGVGITRKMEGKMKRVIYRTFDVKQLEQSRSPDKSAVTYKGIRFVATHRKMPDRQGGPPRVIYRGVDAA